MSERPFLVVALLLQFAASFATGKCVMRFVCDEDDTKSPCVFDGAPQALDTDGGRDRLLDLCGDLFTDPFAAVCCSDPQMDEFAEQIESAKSLGLDNCPACGTNFKNLICSMLCSPDQHEFIQLLRTEVDERGDKIVQELNYHVNTRFASGMYNACVNAKSRIPSINLLHFLCGKWGAECTADRWLQFLGATADGGGLSPIQINYVQTESTEVVVNGTVYRPMNVRPYECNTEDTSKACACQHCPDACPAEEAANAITTNATTEAQARGTE